MNKLKYKKYFKVFLLLLLGIFIVYSIYILLEHRQVVNQSIQRNYDNLSIIADQGNNVAVRMEEFLHLATEENNSKLYDNWSVINGQSRSIRFYVHGISTIHLDKETAADWDLLQYSFIRLDEFIYIMTDKFLEQQSYAISNADKRKMEAVITLYNLMNKEIDNEAVSVENILQLIEEPMLIIDENYSGTLERIGR